MQSCINRSSTWQYRMQLRHFYAYLIVKWAWQQHFRPPVSHWKLIAMSAHSIELSKKVYCKCFTVSKVSQLENYYYYIPVTTGDLYPPGLQVDRTLGVGGCKEKRNVSLALGGLPKLNRPQVCCRSF